MNMKKLCRAFFVFLFVICSLGSASSLEQNERSMDKREDLYIRTNNFSEVFMQTDFWTIGINVYGTLGSNRNTVPDGIERDYRISNVGMYPRGGNFSEVVLVAAPIEGFSVGFNGKSYGNLYYYRQINGTLIENRWVGTIDNLKIEQIITLAGNEIRFYVKLTNTGTQKFTKLRYMRAFDPDQIDNFFQTHDIYPGNVSTPLSKTSSLSLGTSDSRAFGAVEYYKTFSYKCDNVTAATKNITKKNDTVVVLLFELGDLSASNFMEINYLYRLVGNYGIPQNRTSPWTSAYSTSPTSSKTTSGTSSGTSSKATSSTSSGTSSKTTSSKTTTSKASTSSSEVGSTSDAYYSTSEEGSTAGTSTGSSSSDTSTGSNSVNVTSTSKDSTAVITSGDGSSVNGDFINSASICVTSAIAIATAILAL